MLVERHRTSFLDDRGGLAAHGGQPLAELLGVRDGRRQRHQGDRLGQVDDDLLPHRAAGPVGEVVHLVHDHEPQADQGAGAGVQHVAQHLGGHHHDRRLAVDDVVAGQQADLLGAVAGHQVVVLLVRQGLDRRRVEGLASGRQGQVHRELADDGLARPGRGGDEHAAALLDLLAGPHLEVVEGEVVVGGEVAEDGVPGVLAVRRVRSAALSAGHGGDHLQRARGDALDRERQRSEPLAVGVPDDAGAGDGHRAHAVPLVLRMRGVGALEQLRVGAHQLGLADRLDHHDVEQPVVEARRPRRSAARRRTTARCRRRPAWRRGGAPAVEVERVRQRGEGAQLGQGRQVVAHLPLRPGHPVRAFVDDRVEAGRHHGGVVAGSEPGQVEGAAPALARRATIRSAAASGSVRLSPT